MHEGDENCIMLSPNTSWVKAIVMEALRSTIKAHGPITLELIGSVSKRVTGQYNSYKSKKFTQQRLDDIQEISSALRGTDAWAAWKRIKKDMHP